MRRQHTDAENVGVVSILAFVCEMAMLVLLVHAGWHLGRQTWQRSLLAVVLPAAAIGIWARWLAQNAATRLGDPARLIVQTILFVVVGLLLALAGQPALGIAFAVVATAAFALSRRIA